MQACATILCPRHLKAANRACARWTRFGLLNHLEALAYYLKWTEAYRLALRPVVSQEAA